MLLLVVFGLVASTFALPALDLPSPPEAVEVVASEPKLDEIIPNVESQPNSAEKLEEEKRILEEGKRIFEEEKRILDEEKRLIEEKRRIDEETNKIVEEEKRLIEEEEKRMIEEEEKRINEEHEEKLVEEAEKIVEEEKERKIVLPMVPSLPELPPLDDAIFKNILRAEKSEDSQDASKDVKPHILMWKLPRIRFPGRYVLDNIYGPHITLGV